MAKSKIEKEMEAITAVTQALEPLDEGARQRVLDYATDHLGLRIPKTTPTPVTPDQPASAGSSHESQETPRPAKDIRSLKEEKQPSTDIQMVAIVAYYLSRVVPKESRKETIMAKDLETYFIQADYPLPKVPTQTLLNAKNAGYLDSAGKGKYKLNPVGHNLVAHNLPKSDVDGKPRRSRKKTSKKSAKTTEKKDTSKKAG